jgi:hypothetical protein
LNWISANFEIKFKTVIDFEIDLNSREFEDFDRIQSLTNVIRVQMKCLNFRDVTTLSPYRNLILRFRGEENPRLRIDTKYLNGGGGRRSR